MKNERVTLSPPSRPVFRFFFADDPLPGSVQLDPGPDAAFSLFFHRFSMSVFLIRWKYIVTDRLRQVSSNPCSGDIYHRHVSCVKNIAHFYSICFPGKKNGKKTRDSYVRVAAETAKIRRARRRPHTEKRGDLAARTRYFPGGYANGGAARATGGRARPATLPYP